MIDNWNQPLQTTLLACHTAAIRAWERECWGAGGKILECMVTEGMIRCTPGDVFLYLSLMTLSQIKTWWCATWALWPVSQIKHQCLIPKSRNDVCLKNRGQLRQSCISNSTHAFINTRTSKLSSATCSPSLLPSFAFHSCAATISKSEEIGQRMAQDSQMKHNERK